jgi:DNA (cytosine-5)-methyltransferase 1
VSAYYNEIDPYAAQWLRNLIAAGHIADGEVDERSIADVQHEELRGFDQCHFFAGIGVWSHALRRAGWPDDRPIWTGSCPCQPFSAAGKQKGFDDERHLWPIWLRLVDKCDPPIVLGEQVAGALGWLDLVSADLERSDYAFGAADLCAAGFAGAHIRQRLYWVAAHTGGVGMPRQSQTRRASQSRQGGPDSAVDMQQIIDRPFSPGRSWPQPLLRQSDNAFTNWVGPLRAYGNALDAETATQFIAAVMECEL